MNRFLLLASVVALTTLHVSVASAAEGFPVGKWKIESVTQNGTEISHDPIIPWFKKDANWLFSSDNTATLPGYFSATEIRWKYDAASTSYSSEEKNAFGYWIKSLSGSLTPQGFLRSKATLTVELGGAKFIITLVKD
jgi:hypothetical protein